MHYALRDTPARAVSQYAPSVPDANDAMARQLALVERFQTFEPPPFLMGGIAEEALLNGGYTRPHGDLDLLVERSELDDLLRQLRPLGYEDWATKGENASGEPFYLASLDSPVLLELGVTDRDDQGDVYLEIARVHFTFESGEPPVGYRVYLPPDTFTHPPVTLEGIQVRCISPLAGYHLRLGIGSRGTFGPLRDSDNEATARLREKFFSSEDEQNLLPSVESL
jgi:hypothetical protein